MFFFRCEIPHWLVLRCYRKLISSFWPIRLENSVVHGKNSNNQKANALPKTHWLGSFLINHSCLVYMLCIYHISVYDESVLLTHGKQAPASIELSFKVLTQLSPNEWLSVAVLLNYWFFWESWRGISSRVILWDATGRDSFAAFSKDSSCILYSIYSSTLFYHNTWIWRVKIYSCAPVWILVLVEHCCCQMIRLQSKIGFLAMSCVNRVVCIYCWLVYFWLDVNTDALFGCAGCLIFITYTSLKVLTKLLSSFITCIAVYLWNLFIAC